MNPALPILQERIAAKLSELNVTAREISMAATGQPEAVRNILKKNSMPGAERLDAIAAALGTTSDWLLGRERDVEPSAPARTEAFSIDTLRRLPRDLPIYGSALGADLDFPDEGGVAVTVEQTEVQMAEPIDFMARPIGVTGRPDLYVVTVQGNSMFPRYEQGRRLLIDPLRRPMVGEDVIVQLRGPTFDGEEVRHVLIKQLVRRRSGSVALRQFNPDHVFEVPEEQIASVHRVWPWDDALGF